tara:strand:- start:13038 stop:13532 length:495 start_codon:yes stop_codon:yes gene_type:complete
MTNSFIIPTLFNTITGVWYWTFMSSLTAAETHYQIHVFCIVAKTFYGSILSLPLSGILEIVINRLMVWVMIFVLAMDAIQLVVIITNFYSYVISDALATLFGIIFIFLDLFYIGECYNISSKANIEKRYCITKKPINRTDLEAYNNTNLRNRNVAVRNDKKLNF